MDAYTVAYVNRRMVVTHASGVVCEHSIDDLNDVKAGLISRLSRTNDTIAEIDTYIAECEASVAPP